MDIQNLQASLAFAARLMYMEPTDKDLADYRDWGLFSLEADDSGNDDMQHGLTLMGTWCAELDQADTDAHRELMQDVCADWFALIPGSGTPLAPAWAGYYLNANSQILSKETLPVRHIYANWGFEVEHKNSESDDDLGIMLGFLGYLLNRECTGDSEEAARAHADGLTLLMHHILPWICTWAWSMEHHAKTAYCRGIGQYVFGVVRMLAEYAGIQYRPDQKPSVWVLAR